MLIIFGEHILSCWLYQYLRSRWQGSHKILGKFIELFLVHTRPGRPASMFFTILLEEKGGEGFYYLRTQYLRFLRFLVKVSICCPFFRVFLSFTRLFFYRNQQILFWGWLFLIFFHFWGSSVLNLFLFPRMNLAMPQKNVSLSTIKTHNFISFILFLWSRAHMQPLGGVLQKIGSATVLKPIKKYLRMSSIFH